MLEQTKYRRNMLEQCMIKITEVTNNIANQTFLLMIEEKFR